MVYVSLHKMEYTLDPFRPKTNWPEQQQKMYDTIGFISNFLICSKTNPIKHLPNIITTFTLPLKLIHIPITTLTLPLQLLHTPLQLLHYH